MKKLTSALCATIALFVAMAANAQETTRYGASGTAGTIAGRTGGYGSGKMVQKEDMYRANRGIQASDQPQYGTPGMYPAEMGTQASEEPQYGTPASKGRVTSATGTLGGEPVYSYK
jgi:hypothetical protein